MSILEFATVGCVHIYLTHRCQLLFTSPLTTTSAEFPLSWACRFVPSPHSYNLASHYISFEQDLCHCTCGLEVSALAEFYTIRNESTILTNRRFCNNLKFKLLCTRNWFQYYIIFCAIYLFFSRSRIDYSWA